MDQLKLTDNVDTLFKSLENFTQNEGVIGKPVTQGDKTFLPVVSITLGYGTGNASMKGQKDAPPAAGMGASSNNATGALGLGAKLCTDAVIVIDNQNVSLLPVNANAGTLADKIPQMISSMKMGQAGGGQGQNQNQSQNQSQMAATPS